jgi:hypothetical protein
MRTLTYITLALLLLAFSTQAQNKVVLESNGETTVFGGTNAFTDAYNAATDGDVIYLPGQQFSAPTFNKSVAIYGTGIHPDATIATDQTKLSGNVTIAAGASDSHFEGIYFTGNVSFSNAKIDNLSIKRCFIDGNLNLSGETDNPSENVIISESIIAGTFSGNNTKNLIVSNCIIKSPNYNLFRNLSNNAWVRNNIIVGQGYVTTSYNYRYMILDVTETLFENNIFYNYNNPVYTFSNVSNNTFVNNVFRNDPTGDETNTWSGNYTDVEMPGIFKSYLDNTYSFEEDHGLVNPDEFVGTTSNQVGIHGGLEPVKENYLPSIPQITAKDIATSTNEEGKLQVDITVEAQDN